MLYGYARVSTQDQTTDHQVKQLYDYGCKHVFQENASGKSTDRTELNKLQALLVPGDVVVTTKTDRLARNARDLLNLVQFIHDKGCYLVVLDQGIDSRLPMGKVMLQMFGVFAEFERNLLLERQRAGIEKAKSDGKFQGRAKSLNADQIKQLKALWDDRHNTKVSRDQLAVMFSISVPSVYRYVK